MTEQEKLQAKLTKIDNFSINEKGSNVGSTLGIVAGFIFAHSRVKKGSSKWAYIGYGVLGAFIGGTIGALIQKKPDKPNESIKK